MSMPLAITPMVCGKAPSWAAPSIPLANPETTVNPASASAAAKSRASLTAAALALRGGLPQELQQLVDFLVNSTSGKNGG